MSKYALLEVKLELIDQLENSRATIKDEAMSELMTSMRQTGLLQPIGVKKVGKRFEIIYGNRRFQAAKKLGWQTIQAIEVESESIKDDFINNAIENMQRQDVSLPEQGRMFYKLMKEEKMTPSEISARIGVPVTRITRAIDMFHNVPASFRNRIVSKAKGNSLKKGLVPGSTAFAVLNISNAANLNSKQKEEFFEYACQDGVGSDKVQVVGYLLRDGYSLEDAIAGATNTTSVNIRMAIPDTVVTKLEKEYGMTIHKVIHKKLYEELGIKNVAMRSASHKKVILRKKLVNGNQAHA